MRRLALAFLLMPLTAAAQQSLPEGRDCDHPPGCASGMIWNPGSASCEPVSS